MRFVFPSSMLSPKAPDEMNLEQVAAFHQAGFDGWHGANKELE